MVALEDGRAKTARSTPEPTPLAASMNLAIIDLPCITSLPVTGRSQHPLLLFRPAGQTQMQCEPCPKLPSSNTAHRLWAGDPWGIPLVARDVLLRGAIIGAGLYLAGEREHLVRYSLFGAAAIETFVLLWVGAQRT